jgi:hypothetical protein
MYTQSSLLCCVTALSWKAFLHDAKHGVAVGLGAGAFIVYNGR